MQKSLSPSESAHPRTIGWVGTAALAMGGSNQSLFLIAGSTGLFVTQGSAAVPLLILGLLLSWAALPGWLELVLMWPNRVGGIAATCAEAFRPISPVLANLTGVCYWWGWVPTCGLTALLSATAIHTWYLPGVSVPLLAVGFVLFFTAVNLIGIHWVVRLATPLAAASALLAFASGLIPLFAGRIDWRQASEFHLVTPFPGIFGGLSSTMAGLYLIGFAAPAFEQATCHVGETIDHVRNVPRALYASAWMATLYFAVLPVIWLGVLGPQAWSQDLQDILGPTYAPVFGQGARAAAIWFMTFNMFHGSLAPLAGASRTLSQLAEDGLLPVFFAARNRFDVPWVTTVATAAMAILFLLMGDPVWFIAAANLCYLIGIGLPSVAVWLLRRQAPEMARPYRAPRGTILAGLFAALVWGASIVFGLQQYGLPTVLAGIALAYSGSLLYALRRCQSARLSGETGLWRSLHVKLSGAMLLVLALDGGGYLLALNNVRGGDLVLVTVLKDIFVVVALLSISVGLILPGIISHTVGEVARAADRLAKGTLADFSNAMHALANGDLETAHARLDLSPVVVSSRDEVGSMAVSFNLMQQQVAQAARGLDGAREGLRRMRDSLRETNTRLEDQVADRTAALESARQAEDRLQTARAELETRVLERTTALAGANEEIGTRSSQRAAVVDLGQRALAGADLAQLRDRATQVIAETLAVEITAIWETTGEGAELRLCSAIGLPPALVGNLTVPNSASVPVGYALRTLEPVIIRDFLLETRFTLPPHMTDAGVRSAVSTVIGGRSAPYGALSALSTRPREFTGDDVQFLLAMANVLAAAIERKHAEDSLLAANREAERANAAKSEFLSRMSHELRTPLNAILGFGQLLELDLQTPPHDASVRHILKAGRHLLRLIDEVLDISRIEAGRLDLEMGAVPAELVLRDVLTLVKPLADKRGIALEHACGSRENMHYVLADEQRLRQVFLNLLSNAVKYNREGGQVRVGCEVVTEAPAQLRISFVDTGLGIAPEMLGRLFSPFDRLGVEQSGIEGSGLGLALSKRMIEAQKGTISVQSVLGEGSTFAVTLPLAGSHNPLADEPVPAGQPRVPVAVARQGASLPPAAVDAARWTVVYIEDNPSNLNLVQSLLERRRSIRVIPATCGLAGIEIARSARPDLILLDLNLPDISGEEVLRRLQVVEATRRIPVVVISANAIAQRIEATLAAGARDYITKPFDVARLMQVLDEILRPEKLAGTRELAALA